MNVHEIRFGNDSIIPNLFQEGPPRQQFVAPLHHVFEQLKLARPQIDLTVAALHSSIQEIEL
jgi:hypothetical protein